MACTFLFKVEACIYLWTDRLPAIQRIVRSQLYLENWAQHRPNRALGDSFSGRSIAHCYHIRLENEDMRKTYFERPCDFAVLTGSIWFGVWCSGVRCLAQHELVHWLWGTVVLTFAWFAIAIMVIVPESPSSDSADLASWLPFAKIMEIDNKSAAIMVSKRFILSLPFACSSTRLNKTIQV